MRLCQQALQHHGHDEVPVDAETDGRHRDLPTNFSPCYFYSATVKAWMISELMFLLFNSYCRGNPAITPTSSAHDRALTLGVSD